MLKAPVNKLNLIPNTLNQIPYTQMQMQMQSQEALVNKLNCIPVLFVRK